MGIVGHVGTGKQKGIYGSARARGFYDPFDSPSLLSEWTVLLGTPANSGGSLRATALAADGNEIVVNGTMELDSDWASLNAPTTNERSNVQAHGGTYSRHVVCDALGASEQGITQTLGVIVNATYAFGGWIYLVAGAYAYIMVGASPTSIVTVPGSWQQKTGTRIATGVAHSIIGIAHKTAEAYFDDLTCQLSLAILAYDTHASDARITASMISPVALTTPRTLMLRGQNAQNYMCLRLLPNTAGTDTYLETYIAGVRTTVRSADVDWTPGGVDKIRVSVQGDLYTVEHMKSGASAWTTAFTVTDRTFTTSTLFGPVLWATGDSSWADILIDPFDGDGSPLDWYPRTWPAKSAGDFTLVMLPDPQMYAALYPAIGTSQITWITDNAAARDIDMVLHVGDTVDTNADVGQNVYATAWAATLETANIPSLIVPGQHDYLNQDPATGDLTLFNLRFPSTRYTGAGWFTGSLMAPGASENIACFANLGGATWLIIGMEYNPTAPILAWAAAIVVANPAVPVIFITHSYLKPDNTRNAVGEGLWTNFVKLYANMRFVLSGDVGGDGEGYLASVGDLGNTVHQIMVDWQTDAWGGAGYLRIMRFVPTTSNCYITTYSPWEAAWYSDADNEFVISY